MNSRHRQAAAIKAYERLSKRAVGFGVDWDLVSNMVDLRFQLEHALDLYNAGEDQAIITTKAKAHRCKMLIADLAIALQDEMKRVGQDWE